MATSTNLTRHTAVAGTVELPDDPRDCCRAAIEIMTRDEFENGLMEAGDAIEIAWAALANSEGNTPTAELARMLERAGTAFRRFKAGLDSVQVIVRHGTMDHRALDRRLADHATEPTGYQIRGGMIASEAAGKSISEDDAIALLKARKLEDAA